jgi:DNA-directed RNA polymerase specialized sigma24 family protein
MFTGHPHEGGDSSKLAVLTARLRQGDESAGPEIDRLLRSGVFVLLAVRVGPAAAEVWLFDTIQSILHSLKTASPSRMETPLRLVRSVLIHQAERIQALRRDHGAPAPRDHSLTDCERMNRAICELGGSEREAVRRFYVDRESPEEAGSEMGLTGPQFEAVRSEAQRKLRAAWTEPWKASRTPALARLHGFGGAGNRKVNS